MPKAFLTFLFCVAGVTALAQHKIYIKDSVEVRLHPAYNNVSDLHIRLFGENYRKEWAEPTRLPILKISEILGGLKPTEMGGGHQSHSLRLRDSAGVEWVLRTVEKYSEGLAPDIIKGSVYEKWIDDNFSAQHPYSALIVPVLANAVKVPHTNPVIGVVAPDQSLGSFAKDFEGKVCLLEEREPMGDSDNTPDMLTNLDADNDNQLDSTVFFRARLLDLLIADWGRHEDQWRWVPQKNGKGSNYLVVPRDRDQVFYVSEGLLPKTVSKLGTLAFLEGFNATFKDVNAFYINGRKLNQQFLNQYTHDEWMQMTKDFVSALPDTVLTRAVNQLPLSTQVLRKDVVIAKLKDRRDHLMEAMDTYYRFLYQITDIRTSDKNELAEFSETPSGTLDLTIHKLSDSGSKEQVLYQNSFKNDITKEIRLFTGKGNDHIYVNAPASDIKIRVVGGEGSKTYEVKEAERKVEVYENNDADKFLGEQSRIRKHISDDTLNTRKVFSNLYTNSSGFGPTVDLRSVDGIFLGLAYHIKKEGFRKEPYGSLQKFSALKNLNSRALMLQYNAAWISVFKNTDIVVNGLADMKGNILNYFGKGNETVFNRQGDFSTFYRVNFSWYQLDPAFRFKLKNNVTINAGPSFQHFRFNPQGNNGRNINNPVVLAEYDNLAAEKTHGGLLINFNWDKRDSKLLPSKGFNFNVKVQGYEGLNKASGAYAQIFPQLSFYKSLDPKGKIVLAERIGAGFTSGHTEFYQSAFLGSQDNLLGFRKYRFAGDNLAYNNLETRITLPNFLHYVLPGKIGLIGFYDAGRVWVKNEESNVIHQGYGGGVFLSPFNQFFVRAVAGFSNEKSTISIALRQRF